MKKDAEKTKVTFRKEKNPDDIFAVFPELKADLKGNITCYAHIGQHSACHPTYYKHLRKAKPEEYADLKAELESLGYNLEVID